MLLQSRAAAAPGHAHDGEGVHALIPKPSKHCMTELDENKSFGEAELTLPRRSARVPV